jgi:hypothetical protein
VVKVTNRRECIGDKYKKRVIAMKARNRFKQVKAAKI